MRELTITELDVVSGGGLAKALLDLGKAEIISLSAQKAWESATALAKQALASVESYKALLHKHSKAKLLPSYLNLSGNLGVRST